MKEKIFADKKNIYISLLIFALLCSLVFITYAFWQAVKHLDSNVNVTTNLPDGTFAFDVQASDNLEYYFDSYDMLQSEISTDYVAGDEITLTVSLSSSSTRDYAVCTYDIVWNYLSDNIYTTSHAALPLTVDSETYNYEMSVYGSTTITGNNTGVTLLNTNLPESDLSLFTWSNNKATIVSGATIASNSATPTVVTWTLGSRIYNIPANQDDMRGKTYLAKMTVENVDCLYY